MSVTVTPLRVQRLRESMRAAGIDALVCLKPQNSFYLSGFNPIIYSHPVVAILPLEHEPVLLVHALRDDHARASSWVSDIRLHGAWSTKKTMGHDWLAALRAILDEHDLAGSRLGIERDFLPVTTLEQLQHTLPQADLVDASDLLTAARAVKDVEELESLRAAATLSDIGMAAAFRTARAGATEREVSVAAMTAMNEAWMRDMPEVEVADFGSLEGGVQYALWCYTLAGDRIALNCDNPTMRQLSEGEFALVIIWTACNGMHAENERTFAVGRPSADLRRMYDAVLEIRNEAIGTMRPGTTTGEVYGAAKRIYERLGYGDYLPGRMGHGMGLGPHEHPSLAPGDRTVLEPGMVVTWEPNLRIPGKGGMQHSDTIILTEGGIDRITQFRRDFLEV